MDLAAAFGEIALGFSSLMGGPYVDAEAVWPGVAVKDAGGSIVTPGTPVRKLCQAQFDRATQDMRAAPDFLETDVRVLVLASTLDRVLDTEARIAVAVGPHAGSWALLSCTSDPAALGYVCRGRKQ